MESITIEIKSVERKPEALNLVPTYSEITKNSIEKTVVEIAVKDYSVLTTNLDKVLINEITPVGKLIQKLRKD